MIAAASVASNGFDRTVTVAIAGCGFMGRGLVNQLGLMAGVRVTALADRNGGKMRAVVRDAPPRAAGDEEVVLLSDPRALVDAGADVLVDCTGDPGLGAELAVAAIERGVPFVSTAETDGTIGPALARRARLRGAVCGGGAGDEHGEVMKLVREARAAGLDVVAAGKFKKFLDPLATPASVRPFAEKHGQSAFMLASFADGTKMSLELACVANAAGLAPDVRGMHCMRAERDAIPRLLAHGPGGILGRRGVVEVVLGAEPSAGIFAVVEAPHAQVRADLDYLKMGSGPGFLLWKPYHLCAIELATSVAAIARGAAPTIVPGETAVAAVIALAKRDLAAGEALDRIGGFTFRGVIERAEVAGRSGLLPVGLAAGLRLRRAVKAGEPLHLDDVEPPGASLAWRLHEEAAPTSSGSSSGCADRPRGSRRSRRP